MANMAGVWQGVAQGMQLGMQYQNNEERRKRQAQQDQWDAEDRAVAKDKRKQEAADKADLANAYADVKPEVTQSVSGIAAAPVTYDDPSLQNSDIREARRGGAAPVVNDAVTVGGQAVPDMRAAQFHAEQQNASPAKMERVAAVMAKQGKLEESLKLQQFAKTLREEGAAEGIDHIFDVAPSLEDLKKANGGAIDKEIDPKQAARFNGMGQIRLGADHKTRYKVVKAPDGTEIVDATIVDKDGNEQVPGGLRMVQWRLATTPKERQAIERQTRLDDANMSNLAADNKRADAQLAMLKDSKNFEQWATSQRIKIDWKRLESDTDYKTAVLKQYEDGIRQAGKGKEGDGYAGWDKDSLKSLNDQDEEISKAITKARAEGSWDPASTGAQELIKERRVIAARRQQILGKYNGGGTTADPLGLRGSPGASAGAAPAGGRERVDPATQKARDADRTPIYQSELKSAMGRAASAKTPEERSRAEADVASIQAEAKRNGIQLGGASMSAVAAQSQPAAQTAPTAQPAPAAQPAPVAPKPSMQAVAAKDPINGMKPSQARAKRAELVDELKRWQGNPGAAARVAELKELIDRIDTNRY